MHKDCFVGHYRVVPGRRDWTYCPAHSLSLQVGRPSLPAQLLLPPQTDLQASALCWVAPPVNRPLPNFL